MSTYYRLAKVENTLPKHWAYCDAWDLKDGEWIDCRQEGFQVFSQPTQVILAAMGFDMDGSYPANEYPQILLIEADEDCVSDGASLYFAIAHEGVISVKGVNTAAAIEQVEALYDHEKNWYEYDSIEDWAADSEDQIKAILDQLAEPVEVTLIETLPCPVIEVAA